MYKLTYQSKTVHISPTKRELQH